MTEEQLIEGEIVICTVNNIIGTTVFLKIDEYNLEGTMTVSEIAPGRIRNLRDYVSPGRKVVCKVLENRNGNIKLSLRRVKPQEKKELLDNISKENSYKALLKTVLGEAESKQILEKINIDYSLIDFFEKIKQNTQILEKYISKEKANQILTIIDSKKEKEKELKTIFKLSSNAPDGVNRVKKIITESCTKNKIEENKCNTIYLAAGKYNMTIQGEDFKKIKNQINQILTDIEKKAKKEGCEFSIEKS
jgi:translation initiation factor 2 subunit 1